MPKSPESAPEDEARIQESRILSDAELIKGGAHYVPTTEGSTRLEITDEQRKRLKQEGSEYQNELEVVRDFVSTSRETLMRELRYRDDENQVREAFRNLEAGKNIRTLGDAKAALHNIFYAIRVRNHLMNKPYSKELLKEGDLDYETWEKGHEFLDVVEHYLKGIK